MTSVIDVSGRSGGVVGCRTWGRRVGSRLMGLAAGVLVIVCVAGASGRVVRGVGAGEDVVEGGGERGGVGQPGALFGGQGVVGGDGEGVAALARE